MNKGARQLDQPFVESIVGAVPLSQPKLLQHIVRFVKELPVEALEIAEVMRIARFALAGRDERGDFFRFLAQGFFPIRAPS